MKIKFYNLIILYLTLKCADSAINLQCTFSEYTASLSSPPALPMSCLCHRNELAYITMQCSNDLLISLSSCVYNLLSNLN